MNDPRMILKEELYSIGISIYDSTTISLDAGSSQVLVDKEYLRNYQYNDDIIEKAALLITKFYNGELFFE